MPKKGVHNSYTQLNGKIRLIEGYNVLYQSSEQMVGYDKPLDAVAGIPKHVLTGTALDIGSGDGRNSLYLARRGFTVTAIDLSDVGVGKLERSARAQGLDISAIVGDIENMPMDKDYDVIVSAYMLHHLPRGRALNLIRSIKEHTKSSGVNAISVFVKGGRFHGQDPEPDSFYPEPEELQSLYADWATLEFTEERLEASIVDGQNSLNSGVILVQKSER